MDCNVIIDLPNGHTVSLHTSTRLMKPGRIEASSSRPQYCSPENASFDNYSYALSDRRQVAHDRALTDDLSSFGM